LIESYHRTGDLLSFYRGRRDIGSQKMMTPSKIKIGNLFDNVTEVKKWFTI